MAQQLTQLTGANVDEFIASAQPDGRREDAVVIKNLFQQVTGAPAQMWGPSMIGFGEYHYRYASGHTGTCMVLGFSPRKANLVFYGLNIPETEELLPKLGTFKQGAGCVYVGRISHIDLEVMKQIVARVWSIGSYEHEIGDRKSVV